jgi:hypothetical protein
MNVFRLKATELKKVEADLHEQMQDVRRLLAGAREGTAHHAKVKKIEGEVLALFESFRRDVLPLGAPGRLLISGEIEEVLPLDDAKLLEEAKPINSTERSRAMAPFVIPRTRDPGPRPQGALRDSVPQGGQAPGPVARVRCATLGLRYPTPSGQGSLPFPGPFTSP